MIWFIIIMVAIIIGASVLVGKMVSKPRLPDQRSHRQADLTALKASGALQHRKSNRP